MKSLLTGFGSSIVKALRASRILDVGSSSMLTSVSSFLTNKQLVRKISLISDPANPDVVFDAQNTEPLARVRDWFVSHDHTFLDMIWDLFETGSLAEFKGNAKTSTDLVFRLGDFVHGNVPAVSGVDLKVILMSI